MDSFFLIFSGVSILGILNIAICISVKMGLMPSGLHLRIAGPCGNPVEEARLFDCTISQFHSSWPSSSQEGGECLSLMGLSRIVLHCCLSFHVLTGLPENCLNPLLILKLVFCY